MTNQPTHLEMIGHDHLLIHWSDGSKRRYAVRQLRDRCPCATCRERRTSQQSSPPELLPVLSTAEAGPLRIKGMKPVGNYAYTIAFSDGHDTGIYTFEQLQALGEKV